MATIIDALVVTLGLDDKNFSSKRAAVGKGLKDTRDEADKSGKAVKKVGKDGAEGFDTMAKSAVKFLAILGGTTAVKRFIEQTVESNAALSRFARNLDESINTISAWSNAAELAGGTAEGLQGTMDMLSKSQTELLLTGNSGLIPYFSTLGISLADTYGKARPVNDILLDLADRFGKMDRTTANNMGRMMGIDQGTMHLLLKGRTEVELMIKRQKEYSAVTKKQGEEAERLQLRMRESTQGFMAFGRELLSRATPALEKILDLFATFGEWCRENSTFVSTFLAILTAALVGLGLALTPINLTVVAVLALSAALAALWDDYQTWKNGGDALLPWDKWVPAIQRAIDKIKELKAIAGDWIYRIIAGADGVAQVVQGNDNAARFAFNEMLDGNGDSGSVTPVVPPTSTTTPGANAPVVPPTSTTTPGANAPRGIRNNNPGNLNFAGQAGATKEGGPNGRFAKFGSMREGVAALVRQIGLYVKRGKNTIRKIIETYAPSSENNTGAYIAAVARSLGIGADDPLDMENANQVMGLVRAITQHENGGNYVNDSDIKSGFQLARGVPGASKAAAGAGAAKVAMANNPKASGGDNSIETHIGEVNVYTAATDADGIAKDMGKGLNYLFNSQANYGLN